MLVEMCVHVCVHVYICVCMYVCVFVVPGSPGVPTDQWRRLHPACHLLSGGVFRDSVSVGGRARLLLLADASCHTWSDSQDSGGRGLAEQGALSGSIRLVGGRH